MENIGDALQLMVVGMGTVFVILMTVIYLGKGLISLVNRYAPEEAAKKPAVAQAAQVDSLTREIIAEAVKAATGGKGKVESIIAK